MNQLTKFLVDGILNEGNGKVIAAYGGGFKPPTAGHFEVVKRALEQNPEIEELTIFVGGGERDGITQAEAILIWEIFQSYLPMKVNIQPSKAPIGDVIRLGKNNLQDTVYFVIGGREGRDDDAEDIASRTKGIEEKYPNMKVKVVTTPDGGMSGTNARQAAKVSYEEFEKYLPGKLSDEEKEMVYNIVSPSIKEIKLPNISDIKEKFKVFVSKLKQEGKETKAAFALLVKAAKGEIELTDLDKQQIKEQLKDILKGVFGAAVFALPAGGLVLLLLKLIKLHGLVTPTAFLEENDPEDGKAAPYGSGYNELKEGDYSPLGYAKRIINGDISFREAMEESGIPFGNLSDLLKKLGAEHLIATSYNLDNLNENASYSKDIDIKGRIMQLTQHMLDKGYNIEPLPTVEFIDGDSENAREFLGKTAYYNPETQTIVLYTEGRHPKDIVRSFAHEIIHHIQNLEGRLGNITTTNTQEDDYLNDIEAEANLKGTMTFRNWTDSLNESIVGDKIVCDNCGWSWKIVDGGDDLFICHKCGYDNTPLNEEKKPYKHKHGFDDKLGKDPFGLNAYARELALGLEEEIEEGRKKKKDPKKGTGKKPKKSGRRLYTDEDPKDTVGIKFSTRQDIVDTLNKKSFKAKSHARQSQIINLIHQRVRAAYGRAKDPAVKKRLKSGLDYITKKKEASKKKTQRLKKLKEGDTYEKMAAKGKKAGSLKQGTVRKRLGIPKDKKIPLSLINKEIARLKKMDKDPDKKGAQLGDKNQKYYKALQLAKTLKTTTNLNEGRYDAFTNRLSSIVFEMFKDIHDRGDKEGEFEFRVDHPDDEHDIPSKDFYFDLMGKVEITDDEYEVDGGANAGFDKDGNEITPLLSVKFRIPKNPDWQRVSFDIKDVVRHELEHLTQDGDNVKSSKYMEDDQLIRDLIDADMLPKSAYFRLEKEVDAMLQGLYFKAKKAKRPFKDVINDYLNIFIDQETITQEEKENILDIWRSRGKALSLPVFEQIKDMDYEIYSDMDGVLTDFDASFMKASDGILPSEYEKNFGKDGFWELIDGKGVGYWVGMPWMSDGKQYWDYIKGYKPILLSSPSRSQTSRLGKRLWVRNNLPGTKLILAQAKDKQNYAQKNRILIDDRPSNIDQWRASGGIGILHISAADTIRQLKELGL
jgi:hypothetical protein